MLLTESLLWPGASLHFQSRIYNVSEAMKNVSLTVVLATNASLERAVTAR